MSRSASTELSGAVFGNLGHVVVDNLPLATVAFVTMRIDSTMLGHSRDRIISLWPRLEPLVRAPFNVQREHLLSSSFRRLDLAGKQIGDPGICLLSDALAVGALASLQELGLGGNQIGDPGMDALAKACAGGALPQLQELYLMYNQIGDAGVTALAEAFGRGALPKCTYLELSGNPASDEAKSAVANAALKR
jgi:hypothetical protein